MVIFTQNSSQNISTDNQNIGKPSIQFKYICWMFAYTNKQKKLVLNTNEFQVIKSITKVPI